jgi:hypothetical protein
LEVKYEYDFVEYDGDCLRSSGPFQSEPRTWGRRKPWRRAS